MMVGLGLNAGFCQGSGSGAKSSPAPSLSNTKSLFTDGVDDSFDVSLGTDIIPHDAGSISMWFQVDGSQSSNGTFIDIYDASALPNGRIIIALFKNTATTWSLHGQYKDEPSNGTFSMRWCQAKQDAAYHGSPYTRVEADYASKAYNAIGLIGDRTWHHVVFCWDRYNTYDYSSTTYNGLMKIYLDGELMNVGSSTAATPGSTGSASGLNGFDSGTVIDKIRVGDNAGSNQPVDCLTDEVAIFNQVLSDSDVTSIYNSGVPTDLLSSYSTKLIGWWRFEDNTDDSSNNSNSGTLTNGATYDTDVPS